MLEEDLSTDGPVFGKFERSMTGAASGSVLAASRQGEMVGHIPGSARLEKLTRDAGLEGDLLAALDDADPDAASLLEREIMGEQKFMWVAELVNTCHRCMPLHGSIDTLNGWSSRGLHPDSIHAGWDSACHCRLLEQSTADETRTELMAPLKRNKLKTPTGLKGQRKTERAITKQDINASQRARDAAMKTEEGRRTLRILGQANRDADENSDRVD
jgi:hypothetical protein